MKITFMIKTVNFLLMVFNSVIKIIGFIFLKSLFVQKKEDKYNTI